MTYTRIRARKGCKRPPWGIFPLRAHEVAEERPSVSKLGSRGGMERTRKRAAVRMLPKCTLGARQTLGAAEANYQGERRSERGGDEGDTGDWEAVLQVLEMTLRLRVASNGRAPRNGRDECWARKWQDAPRREVGINLETLMLRITMMSAAATRGNGGWCCAHEGWCRKFRAAREGQASRGPMPDRRRRKASYARDGNGRMVLRAWARHELGGEAASAGRVKQAPVRLGTTLGNGRTIEEIISSGQGQEQVHTPWIESMHGSKRCARALYGAAIVELGGICEEVDGVKSCQARRYSCVGDTILAVHGCDAVLDHIEVFLQPQMFLDLERRRYKVFEDGAK
ncbi:hypothetical protein B0H12DRAFT_1077600 [Mycena haematopus]|nr:hypothetical protein B0H12DRAFT_1077600 [Mycena haematopus]